MYWYCRDCNKVIQIHSCPKHGLAGHCKWWKEMLTHKWYSNSEWLDKPRRNMRSKNLFKLCENCNERFNCWTE